MDPRAAHTSISPKLDPAEDAFTLIQYVPDLPGLPVFGVRAGSLDNLLALEVRNELASPLNRFVKRGIDITATVVGGLLISPILLGLAAAVALDSRGPVFFGHTRIGRNGRQDQGLEVPHHGPRRPGGARASSRRRTPSSAPSGRRPTSSRTTRA